MAALVLDSSVTISWLIPEEVTAPTQKVLENVASEGAVVPSLWFLEIGNTLLQATRRNRISPVQCAKAIMTLKELPIERDIETNDLVWDITFRMAAEFNLTLYDACYLELAYRRSLPLASLDRQLRTAAKTMGLDLLGV